MASQTHPVTGLCTLYDAAVTISKLQQPQVQEEYLGLFFQALTVETHSDEILRIAQDALIERLLYGETGKYPIAP